MSYHLPFEHDHDQKWISPSPLSSVEENIYSENFGAIVVGLICVINFFSLKPIFQRFHVEVTND